MKCFLLVILILICCSFIWCSECNRVLKAANRDILKYLEAIQSSNMQRFGFQSESQINNTVPGEPFQIAILNPEKINELTEICTIESLSDKTDLWYVPIISQEQICCFLLVDKINDEFKAVSIGYRPLAVSLFRYFEKTGRELQNTRFYQCRRNGTIYMHPVSSEEDITIMNSKSIAEMNNDFVVQSIKKTVLGLKKVHSDSTMGKQEM